MIVRAPTTISTNVTNSPKLSATMTPKPTVLRFHNRPADSAAPPSPISPHQPIGRRSLRPRNASVPIVASAVSVMQSIGIRASRSVLNIQHHLFRPRRFRVALLDANGLGVSHLFDNLAHRRFHRLEEQHRE